MNVAPEVIQKISVLAIAQLADRAARVGSHVAGRAVSYGALRGAVRGAVAGAARGAYRGFLETRRVRNAMRIGRNFHGGLRAGYSNSRFLAGGADSQERNARLLRTALARRTRAGAAGHALGTRAYSAQTKLGRAGRTLVRSFQREGRRIASYWRNKP